MTQDEALMVFKECVIKAKDEYDGDETSFIGIACAVLRQARNDKQAQEAIKVIGVFSNGGMLLGAVLVEVLGEDWRDGGYEPMTPETDMVMDVAAGLEK